MSENVSRRQFLQASALAMAGLGLAGCGNGGTEGGDATEIKVGILGPHTGDNSSYGLACKNGAQLYFDQLNADGGINGKQVTTFVYDDKGDATEAVNAYNSLVQNDGVTAIVGAVLTVPSIAVAKASVADNMPCVTPSATAADVVTFGDNTFRTCVTDPVQGVVMADFAAEQGYKNVATLYKTGDDYNEGVNAAFCEEAEAKGITITSQQSYSDGDVDFNTQLTAIIATNPDAILLPNYYQEDGMIVTQARQQGYDKVFLGVDGWSGIYGGPENYADAADLHDCYYCCAFSVSNETEVSKAFTEDYQEAYGEAPTNFCALGYDAAMTVAAGLAAAEEAGLEAGSEDYKQAVIDGIASATVEGVTGTISYDGTGDPVKSSLILTFAEDGSEKTFDIIEA